MISAVGQTGGHLGSGLGVVELTVAIHYVFNTPDDRLVWDVGHQAYPHKILTGRRSRIRTLRQGGGLSGFTKRSESEYDPFGAAHSSTSISAALGFAVANKLADKPGRGIAVIGDHRGIRAREFGGAGVPWRGEITERRWIHPLQTAGSRPELADESEHQVARGLVGQQDEAEAQQVRRG